MKKLIIIFSVVHIFHCGTALASWIKLDAPGATWTEIRGVDGENIVGHASNDTWGHDFLYDGTSWSPQAKLVASDSGSYDWGGQTVSISGDYALMGATGHNYGAAYVFKRDGTSWTQQAKLTASDGGPADDFGQVSLSGDYAIIGAGGWDPPFPWDNWENTGAAYIFKRDGTSWSEQDRLEGIHTHSNSNFGRTLSISGDYAIVGANRDKDDAMAALTGAAFIYKRDGTSWNTQGIIKAPDRQAIDLFGYSVSISSDFAVVGAINDDDNGENSGSAYVFERNGTSWTLQSKLLASDGADYDGFGKVSVNGNNVLVGASGDDDDGSMSGSVYVFEAEFP